MKKLTIISLVSIFAFLFILTACKKDEDTTPPVITLIGNNPQVIEVNTDYQEAGATAEDDTDGDITSDIKITNNIDKTTEGNYQVKYNVKDKAGNAAKEVIRTVTVMTF